MHDDGAIAEHDDQHWKDKGEQRHGQAQAKKKIWAVVFHAGQSITRQLHSPVHQGRDAKHQGAQPDCSTSGSNALTAPEIPGVHQLHHSQVAIDTHAGEEEDVGEAVHSNDIAAQLAQQVPSWPKVPVAVLARRDGPQWQREDKDEVGQGQVDNKRVHQTPTSPSFVAHNWDYKEVAQKACEKDDAIQSGQEDIGTMEVWAGAVQCDIKIKWSIVSNVVVVVIVK